jgi:ABC-2 type transport system permease protein
LLRQRRTLLLVLLAVLPMLLAVLFRVTGNSHDEDPDFTVALLAHFVVGLILPLTALVVGTAALGQELEDGTIVYLIAKPLARWRVVLAKIVAAWLVTSAVVVPAVLAAGGILLAGSEEPELLPAFAVAVLVGALAYTALFVSLSVRFTRALIIGLVYALVWETLISQFISGVRFLSVRDYTLGIAQAIANSSSELLEETLGAAPAVILMAILTVVATWYGIRCMDRYQMSERV